MSGEMDITITALHKDNKGNIYAGTIGKGLCLLRLCYDTVMALLYF